MTRVPPTYSIAELEALATLEFASLSTDEAVTLGLVAFEVIQERDLSLAVDVVIHGDLVFRAKLKSTGPDNDPWLRGKSNVALGFGEPSLLVRQRHIEAGTAFEDRTDIDHDQMRAFGGSVPLRVAGSIIGTLTVSGEPDAIDHETAVEAIERYLRGHT